MAWSDPRTWVDGETVTSPILNAHIRDQFRALWNMLADVEFTGNVAASSGGTECATAGAISFLAYPLLVEFYAAGIDATVTLKLYDGTTELGILNTPAFYPFVRVERTMTPDEGSHTYRVLAFGASGSVYAGAGGVGVLFPGYIRLWQKGGPVDPVIPA